MNLIPTMRMYESEEDCQLIRDFLRRTLIRNGLRQLSWHVARFDYWWCQGIKNERFYRPEDSIFIWETNERGVVAVLNPEGKGDVFIQVDPDFATPALEEEMLVQAENRFPVAHGEGGRRIRIWADSRDILRHEILVRRGYAKDVFPEHQRRRLVTAEIREAPVPAKYDVRSLGGDEELPARSWASWKSFHPKEPDNRYEGWEWYRNIQTNPLYRPDLDLVVTNPNGDIVSFCTVWFDEVTRTAIFEPVGTVSEHQRRGFGKAVMTEGMRRLRGVGATMAFVGGYSIPANALYSSVGFNEGDLSEPWTRVFKDD